MYLRSMILKEEELVLISGIRGEKKYKLCNFGTLNC